MGEVERMLIKLQEKEREMEANVGQGLGGVVIDLSKTGLAARASIDSATIATMQETIQALEKQLAETTRELRQAEGFGGAAADRLKMLEAKVGGNMALIVELSKLGSADAVIPRPLRPRSPPCPPPIVDAVRLAYRFWSMLRTRLRCCVRCFFRPKESSNTAARSSFSTAIKGSSQPSQEEDTPDFRESTPEAFVSNSGPRGVSLRWLLGR